VASVFEKIYRAEILAKANCCKMDDVQENISRFDAIVNAIYHSCSRL